MARTELDLNWKKLDVTGDDSPSVRIMGNQLQELLTVDEVAALLKVSRSWVYEHTRRRGRRRSGRLAHVKVGKYVRFEPRAVREFLAELARMP